MANIDMCEHDWPGSGCKQCFPAKPDPIERIARAMALADGLDPDERVSGGPNKFAVKATDFNGYAICCKGPAWHTYRREANLLLAGLAELELIAKGR
jgi:hypothetical protein